MKKGDKVLVYGTIVNWRDAAAWQFKAEYWFLRGTLAKVLGVVSDSEITIKFLKDTRSMRPVTGMITEVHPKQCRKVKT